MNYFTRQGKTLAAAVKIKITGRNFIYKKNRKRAVKRVLIIVILLTSLLIFAVTYFEVQKQNSEQKLYREEYECGNCHEVLRNSVCYSNLESNMIEFEFEYTT